jgi:hypothetical protein
LAALIVGLHFSQSILQVEQWIDTDLSGRINPYMDITFVRKPFFIFLSRCCKFQMPRKARIDAPGALHYVMEDIGALVREFRGHGIPLPQILAFHDASPFSFKVDLMDNEEA